MKTRSVFKDDRNHRASLLRSIFLLITVAAGIPAGLVAILAVLRRDGRSVNCSVGYVARTRLPLMAQMRSAGISALAPLFGGNRGRRCWMLQTTRMDPSRKRSVHRSIRDDHVYH